MDMQPNRNMAVENQLQAVQLGASLYDRAQTQKRMMEQFQLQSADQVMRQRQADLQNKIQSNAYGQALQEQDAQVAEFDTFQTFNNEVSNFLNNSTAGAAIPSAPRFKSKVYNQEAMKAIGGIEQYSVRAEHVKAQQRLAAAAMSQQTVLMNNAMKYGAVSIDPETGAPKIDFNLAQQRATESFNTSQESKSARTQAAIDRVDIAERNLARMLSEGASRNEIDQQRLELTQTGLDLRRELGTAGLSLRRELGTAGLDLRRELGAANVEIAQQRIGMQNTYQTAQMEALSKRMEVAQNTLDQRISQQADKKEIDKAKLEIKDSQLALSKYIAENKAVSQNTSKLKPTKLDLDELEFSEAVLNGIKPMEPYLTEDLYGPSFNAKVYGGGVFNTFGPEREVNQLYKNMSSGALFKRGGKALTKPEISIITASIGNPTDTGFPARVETFKRLTARNMKDRVEKLRLQGIDKNPQYGAYIDDIERRANEVLGVKEESNSGQGAGGSFEQTTPSASGQGGGGVRVKFDSQGNEIQ
jgi:hypothetical protein